MKGCDQQSIGIGDVSASWLVTSVDRATWRVYRQWRVLGRAGRSRASTRRDKWTTSASTLRSLPVSGSLMFLYSASSITPVCCGLAVQHVDAVQIPCCTS